MGPTDASEKLDWAVAVHRRDAALEVELAQAVCRCLRVLCYSAQIVCDGEPDGLRACSLLLLTNCANFPAYSRLLRGAGTARPTVLVWQMDPLPPNRLPPLAETLIERATLWRTRLGLATRPNATSRWRRLITARRLRGRLYRFLSGFSYRAACRVMGQFGGLDAELDWTQIRGTAEAWVDLRQGLEGAWIDHLAVSTRQRQRFLAERGIPAPFIPVGSCPELGNPMDLARDVEVLFIGRVKHGPRASKLVRIARDLAAEGILLRQITADCYGTERTRWLNRSHLVLNLHNYPWSPAWIRFVMAALCGAVVVSEPSEDQEPFVAGRHYAAAPAAQLPETIRVLLNDPAGCAGIRSAAAELCRDSLTMLDSVGRLCSLIASKNA
jgi:hypothetical protein